LIVVRRRRQDVGFKDKHWHDRCFVCKECCTELIDKPFAYRDDNLFCAACYEKNPSLCAACGKAFEIGELIVDL
jgi:LIM domain-containing protein 2